MKGIYEATNPKNAAIFHPSSNSAIRNSKLQSLIVASNLTSGSIRLGKTKYKHRKSLFASRHNLLHYRPYDRVSLYIPNAEDPVPVEEAEIPPLAPICTEAVPCTATAIS
jgi:hypothetical protein